MVEKSSSSSSTHAVLGQTLKKTVAVAEDVHRASQNLSVVSTVLEQELPDEVQTGEVAQAIAHTNELEKKLAASAEKLEEVNAALAKEIEKRIEVTEQRDESRATVREMERQQRQDKDSDADAGAGAR